MIELFCRRLAGRFVARTEKHPKTFAGELARHFEPDSFICAGHEGGSLVSSHSRNCDICLWKSKARMSNLPPFVGDHELRSCLIVPARQCGNANPEISQLPLQQPLVFIMRPNPDPEKAIRHIDGDRAVTGSAQSNRVNITHFLEPKGSSTRVLFPSSIRPARRPPYRLGQAAIQFPKFIGPRRFHPSIGSCRRRARRELGRSSHRTGLLLHPAQIPRPRAGRDAHEAPAPASMPPSAEDSGWLRGSQSPCSQPEVYTPEQTVTKENVAIAVVVVQLHSQQRESEFIVADQVSGPLPICTSRAFGESPNATRESPAHGGQAVRSPDFFPRRIGCRS